MTSLMARLDSLDGNRTLGRGKKEHRNAIAVRLLVIWMCLAALAPATLTTLADTLIWPLEARFERKSLDDEHQEIAGFIALGGGDERVIEAARLARAHPSAKLVITGHGKGAVRLARQSGLSPNRVLIEPAAQNTFENAQFTAPLLGGHRTAIWVLVTSASHMPRAIGCFRKAAIAVEAWPVADVSHGWHDTMSMAAHEWFGMLYYWLRGRTDALFPAPHERPLERAMIAAREQDGPDYQLSAFTSASPQVHSRGQASP